MLETQHGQTGANSIASVRRTTPCAAQCAHVRHGVRRTVHCAHTMLTARFRNWTLLSHLWSSNRRVAHVPLVTKNCFKTLQSPFSGPPKLNQSPHCGLRNRKFESIVARTCSLLRPNHVQSQLLANPIDPHPGCKRGRKRTKAPRAARRSPAWPYRQSVARTGAGRGTRPRTDSTVSRTRNPSPPESAIGGASTWRRRARGGQPRSPTGRYWQKGLLREVEVPREVGGEGEGER